MAGSSAGSRWRAVATAIVDRRRVAFALWAAAALVLLPLARGAERRLLTGATVPGSESERVTELLATRFASPFARWAIVVVRGVPPLGTAGGGAVLAEVVAALRRAPVVAGTFSALDVPDTLFRGAGADGGTFIVVGLRDSVRGDSLVVALRAATRGLTERLRPRWPRAELLVTGELPLTVDLRQVSADDASRAERRVLPLTLALLVVAFGALAAAALPVLAGALAIGLTTGVIALVARALPVSVLVLNVTTMLGLGLGIDYALLLVSRFREERRAGRPPRDAAVEATVHAGHGIVLSGAAVLVGFAALLAVPLTDLRSIAIGGFVVTAASVLVAVTLLPGVLAALGARVETGRVRRAATGERRWRAWSGGVVRRPLLALAAAGIPLLLLAAQWRRLDARMPSGDWLPGEIESARGVRALVAMRRAGLVQAVRVVIELPAGTSALDGGGWRAVTAAAERLGRDPRVARVRSLPAIVGPSPAMAALAPAPIVASFASVDRRLALLEVMPADAAGSDGAMTLVRDLRRAPPGSLTGLRATRIVVGGLPAFDLDYQRAAADAAPRVVLLVLAGSFVALLLGFRSVLVPLKAIALNLLSVGAALGAVVLVFLDGHGARLLGLAAPLDGVFPAVPLLVFCVVFGLSMDYEVFLVARVAEARRGGAGESAAVVEGVARTGGVITSAALIMTVVFGAFVAGSFVLMKVLGFALAVAVLLDVTVVRLVLGPALLRLAGRWNWWPGTRRPANDAARGWIRVPSTNLPVTSGALPDARTPLPRRSDAGGAVDGRGV